MTRNIVSYGGLHPTVAEPLYIRRPATRFASVDFGSNSALQYALPRRNRRDELTFTHFEQSLACVEIGGVLRLL